MRSILEKAFVALLNEEHDTAEELFHKFIVERARQIHEANRAGDDSILSESWDEEITTESYFTEEDLADLEESDDEEEVVADDGDDFGDDFGDEVPDEFEAGEETGEEEVENGDEFGDELGDDDFEGDEAQTDSERIDDLEAQIEKINQEFEAMMDTINDGDDDFDSEVVDGDFEDEVPDEFEAGEEAGEEEADADFADNVEDDMGEEGEEGEEEDYDDLGESITSELEKVQVTLSDGHGVGKGGSFSQNKGAAIPQKNKDARQGGTPIQMKQSSHKGFARETAPTVADMKTRRNNVTKPMTDKVPEKGAKGALVNQAVKTNTRSPITPAGKIKR